MSLNLRALPGHFERTIELYVAQLFFWSMPITFASAILMLFCGSIKEDDRSLAQ